MDNLNTRNYLQARNNLDLKKKKKKHTSDIHLKVLILLWEMTTCAQNKKV